MADDMRCNSEVTLAALGATWQPLPFAHKNTAPRLPAPEPAGLRVEGSGVKGQGLRVADLLRFLSPNRRRGLLQGEYKLDKMHGRGVYVWAEGARYEGEYKEDKKNGRGVQTWPSGARYEGEYVDSMQTGYGLMTWADGRRYEGYWVNSKCTGFGVLTHKDGRRYEGEYVNDKMQGHGVYTYASHPTP